MDIAQAISCTHTTIHVLPEATPMIDPKKVSPTHHLNPVRQLGASHSFVAEIFAYDRPAAASFAAAISRKREWDKRLTVDRPQSELVDVLLSYVITGEYGEVDHFNYAIQLMQDVSEVAADLADQATNFINADAKGEDDRDVLSDIQQHLQS